MHGGEFAGGDRSGGVDEGRRGEGDGERNHETFARRRGVFRGVQHAEIVSSAKRVHHAHVRVLASGAGVRFRARCARCERCRAIGTVFKGARGVRRRAPVSQLYETEAVHARGDRKVQRETARRAR